MVRPGGPDFESSWKVVFGGIGGELDSFSGFDLPKNWGLKDQLIPGEFLALCRRIYGISA